MAYAIIEMGGKQYRVEKGDSVLVDRVSEDEGAKLSPRALLYSGDGQAVFEGADLDKVKIEAVVAEHLKGEKIRVFKYRPKKRYRKTQGHRSLLSRLEIREVKGPSAAKAAAGSTQGSKRAAGSAEGSKAAAGSTQGSKRAAGSGTGRSKAKEEEGE
jgi:large subunit ribosomal protein L21